MIDFLKKIDDPIFEINKTETTGVYNLKIWESLLEE